MTRLLMLLLVVLLLLVVVDARKPSSYPTTKPTKKKTSTAFPTTATKPSSPLLNTREDEDLEILSTRVPSAMLTTLFPTLNPATRQPTSAAGESKCHLIEFHEQCAERSNDCEWYAMQTCDYTKTPAVCKQHEYGCQDRRQFCEFTKGSSTLERQMQCNNKGFPCQWDSNAVKCKLATRAPSPPPFSLSMCDNSCSKARNGKCNDGGAGSVNSVCALGTDCRDCGVRLVD